MGYAVLDGAEGPASLIWWVARTPVALMQRWHGDELTIHTNSEACIDRVLDTVHPLARLAIANQSTMNPDRLRAALGLTALASGDMPELHSGPPAWSLRLGGFKS